MLLPLVRVDLANQSCKGVGYASSLAEADKLLSKLAKQEAKATGQGTVVAKQSDGYCVVNLDGEPYHLALYTFNNP